MPSLRGQGLPPTAALMWLQRLRKVPKFVWWKPKPANNGFQHGKLQKTESKIMWPLTQV
jgi:hypothetical protein